MWNRKELKKCDSKIYASWQTYFLCVGLSFVYQFIMGILFEEIPVVEFLEKLTEEVTKLHVWHVIKHLLIFFGEVVKFPFEGLMESFTPIVKGETALTFAVFMEGIRHALLHMVLPAHLLHLAVEFLVGLPYEVGMNRSYLKIRKGENVNIADTVHGFKSLKAYHNVLFAQVMREVLTFIFKLLLFVPGVRHHYELFCVPFILAENPNLSWRHVHHMSEEMTHGYKWELFKLEYSFLGWMLLDALTFHLLGIFYLKPRMHATFAEAYAFLRKNAIEKGIVEEEELSPLASV
ncbi:MAG: DUF975 family protein [Oscillospiraceae bacterium]|nr:DUF975 family protein [Oscillospiraceae bacterium]